MRGLKLTEQNKYNAEEMMNEFLLLQEQKRVVKTTLRSHKYALIELHKELNRYIRECLPSGNVQ